MEDVVIRVLVVVGGCAIFCLAVFGVLYWAFQPLLQEQKERHERERANWTRRKPQYKSSD